MNTKIFSFILLNALVFMNIHSSNTTLELSNTLRGMSSAFVISRALQVAAEIKIADFLDQKESRSITYLAEKTKTHPHALYRLMRMLSSHGIFYEHDNKMFTVTELGYLLKTDVPGSVRTFLVHDDAPRWHAYANLKDTLTTNSPSFDQIFGMGYYDFLSKDKEAAARFDTAMNRITQIESESIVKNYDFKNYSTIIDIGGGEGEFLGAVLKAFPSCKGIVFDLPHVVEKINFSATPEVKDRISGHGGSFFDAIPTGGDLYIAKRVLHNWSDVECVTILTKCAQAMSTSSKLLIIEALVKGPNQSDGMKDWDIYGMTLMNGKERTEQEWSALCEKAGLIITSVLPTDSFVSVMEIKKK